MFESEAKEESAELERTRILLQGPIPTEEQLLQDDFWTELMENLATLFSVKNGNAIQEGKIVQVNTNKSNYIRTGNTEVVISLREEHPEPEKIVVIIDDLQRLARDWSTRTSFDSSENDTDGDNDNTIP